MKRIISILIIFISFMFFASCSNNKEKDSIDIYNSSLSSVVELKVIIEDIENYGSATCINNDRLFVTNAHIFNNKEISICNAYIRYATEDDYVNVNIINIDYDKDIAYLKDNNSKLYKSLNYTYNYSTGEKVYTVGNTSNQGISIASGIISNSSVLVNTGSFSMNMIATDAFFAEGNSGGALLNEEGKLLGITTLRLKDKYGNIIYGIGYVIPIKVVIDNTPKNI